MKNSIQYQIPLPGVKDRSSTTTTPSGTKRSKQDRFADTIGQDQTDLGEQYRHTVGSNDPQSLTEMIAVLDGRIGGILRDLTEGSTPPMLEIRRAAVRLREAKERDNHAGVQKFVEQIVELSCENISPDEIWRELKGWIDLRAKIADLDSRITLRRQDIFTSQQVLQILQAGASVIREFLPADQIDAFTRRLRETSGAHGLRSEEIN